MDTGFIRLVGKLKANKPVMGMVAILKLVRIRNCLITFLGVMVGAYIVGSGDEIFLMKEKVMLAGIVAFLVVGGGNALNDFFDFEVDKINRPDKPIPSGRISRSDALMLAAGFFLIGLGLSKSINRYCLIIAFVNAAILVLYARYSKKLLLISNLSISYLVASVFLFGSLSVMTSFSGMFGQMKLILVLIVCAFFMTFSREIIKDIEDMGGDQRRYSKTLPIVIGVKKARNVAVWFGIVAIMFSLVPVVFRYGNVEILAYGLLVGIADLFFLSALTMYASLAQRTMVIGMVLSLFGFLISNVLAKI